MDLKYEKMKMTEKEYYKKTREHIHPDKDRQFEEYIKYITNLEDIGFYYHKRRHMMI